MSVHIWKGNQSRAESSALWAEHPNGTREIVVGLSSANTLLSAAEAEPFSRPISLLFAIKGVGPF